MTSEEKGDVMECFTVKPIGHVRSRYHSFDDIPHAHARKGWTEDDSRIELLPKHAKKLKGLEDYSHLIVLYWIHRSREWRMPKDRGKPPHVRLFGTRMPARPNPIGLSVVEIRSFSAETGEVVVKGLDALDGTPLLDMKPYIPYFDSLPEATVPDWLIEHIEKYHHSHSHSHG